MTKAADLSKTGSLVNSSGQLDLTTGVTGILPVANGGTGQSNGSLTLSGNLAFSGTGNRITGDFSNATIANRVAFQTSTANSVTVVTAIPNGTGTQANFNVHNNSDPTNASDFRFLINATDARLQSSQTGTGSYLPLTMYTGGSERLRIDTSGNVGIGTSSPLTKLDFGPVANNTQIISVRQNGNNRAGLGINSDYGLRVTGPSDSTATISFGSISVSDGSTFTERMRIGSAGQLGIGGANYGTAGQVLVSQGSSAAPVWGSGGKVLQVIQTVKTDTFSTTSQQPTYADVTGMSVSITPSSSSSKILVFASFQMQTDQATNYAVARLVRDSTAIFVGDANGSNARASGAIALSQTYSAAGVAITYLDSPATTSAVTYKIQMAKGEGSATAYMNRGGDGDTGTNRARTPSSITVMEIAG